MKTTMTRLFAILMCMVMLAYVMPLFTMAETVITNVDITGVTEPVAGQVRNIAFSVETVGVTSTGTSRWWNMTDLKEMEDGDTFEAGKEYRFDVFLKYLPGYVWAEDAKDMTATLNGKEAVILQSQPGDNKCVKYTFICPGDPNTISNITISDADVVPYIGEPASNYLNYTVPENCHYSMETNLWYNEGTGNYLPGSENAFANGNTYTHVWNLAADEGYTFAESPTVIINGTTIYVDTTWTKRSNDGTMFEVWTLPVVATSPFAITEIEITDADVTPIVGDKAGEHLEFAFPENCEYTLSSHGWSVYNLSDLENDVVFEKDTVYTTCWNIAPNKGCAFDDDVTVTINGSTDLVGDIRHYNGNLIVFSTPAEAELVIKTYSITNGTEKSDEETNNGCIEVDRTSAIQDETVTVTVNPATGYMLKSLNYVETIWKNVPDAGPVDWSQTYRFAKRGSETGDELTVLSDHSWNTITTGAFYLKFTGTEDFEIEVTTGWWDGKWPADGYITKNSDLVADNHDGTYTLKIDFSDYDEFLAKLPTQHLLISGKGFTPLELYGQPTEVKKNASGLYSFKMPETDITVVAEFEEDTRIVIDKIEINDVDMIPIYGEKAGDHLGYTLPDDCHYTVERVWWQRHPIGSNEEYCDMDNEQTFEKETMYVIQFFLLPDAGYVFTTDTTATLNGSAESVGWSYLSGSNEFVIDSEPTTCSESAETVVDLRIGDKEFVGVKGGETLIVESLDVMNDITVLTQNGVDIEGLSEDWSMSTKFLDSENRGVLEVQVFAEGDDYVTINLQSHYADCPGATVDDFQIMLITLKLSSAAVLGDANDDGKVDMKDVLLLRKFLAGMTEELNKGNADANEDGSLDMKDVLMIRKYLANMIEKLGA